MEELKKLVSRLKEYQEELDSLGPFEKPKEYGQLQSELKRLDNTISGVKEKQNIFEHKRQKIQEILDSGDKQLK